MNDKDSVMIYNTGSTEAEGGEPTATRVFCVFSVFFACFYH